MKRNKGFSLIEIILALAVSVIVFIGIFHFAASLYVKSNSEMEHEKFFTYRYGEAYCPLEMDLDDVQFNALDVIRFSGILSTSTKITSMHFVEEVGNENTKKPTFIITTDSASTSESDIFMIIINPETGTSTVVDSIDAGPGIQDSKLLDTFLYVANTSVNSHIKTIHINTSTRDTNATSANRFAELANIKIPSLSTSGALPKKLAVFNDKLILGSEKNNSGPEVFIFQIDQDGVVRNIQTTLELGGQMNQTAVNYDDVYITNAADPELRVYDSLFRDYFAYDAPLTLGNGKSILYKDSFIIFGRTLGSGELSLLKANGTTTEVFDTKRTNGTVDYLQDMNKKYFLAFTANEEKELQFWSIEKTITRNEKLIHKKDLDVLGRVTSYTCAKGYIFASILQNNQPAILWIKI